MRLVNTTPVDLVLFTPDGPRRLPAATAPARLTDPVIVTDQPCAFAVPVRDVVPGTVVHDLPEPVDGVHYVVSRAVALARVDRGDLLVPGIVRVRPPHGLPGCADLVRFHHRDERPLPARRCAHCHR